MTFFLENTNDFQKKLFEYCDDEECVLVEFGTLAVPTKYGDNIAEVNQHCSKEGHGCVFEAKDIGSVKNRFTDNSYFSFEQDQNRMIFTGKHGLNVCRIGDNYKMHDEVTDLQELIDGATSGRIECGTMSSSSMSPSESNLRKETWKSGPHPAGKEHLSDIDGNWNISRYNFYDMFKLYDASSSGEIWTRCYKDEECALAGYRHEGRYECIKKECEDQGLTWQRGDPTIDCGGWRFKGKCQPK